MAVSDEAFQAHLELNNYKFDDIKGDINRVDERCSKIKDRIVKLDEKYDVMMELVMSLNSMPNNVETMNKQLETVYNSVNKLKDDMSTELSSIHTKLSSHDAKLSEIKYSDMKETHTFVKKLKEHIITIIITAIVVAALTYVFPMIPW